MIKYIKELIINYELIRLRKVERELNKKLIWYLKFQLNTMKNLADIQSDDLELGKSLRKVLKD